MGGAPAQEGPDEHVTEGSSRKGKGKQGRWGGGQPWSQSLRLVRRPSTWGGKGAKMED